MRTHMKSAVLAAVLGAAIAVTGLTGCATRGQAREDRRISSDVKSRLKKEPVYKFEDVNVTSYDGVVQLSGFAQTEGQRKRAGEIASTVPAVKEVVNNILVNPNLMPTGRTSAPIRMGQPGAPSTSPSTTTNAPAPTDQPK